MQRPCRGCAVACRASTEHWMPRVSTALIAARSGSCPRYLKRIARLPICNASTIRAPFRYQGKGESISPALSDIQTTMSCRAEFRPTGVKSKIQFNTSPLPSSASPSAVLFVLFIRIIRTPGCTYTRIAPALPARSGELPRSDVS